MTPAVRRGAGGAVDVGGLALRAAEAVGVHPVVVGPEDRGEPAGPHRPTPRQRAAAAEGVGESGVVAGIRPLLRVGVELRRHVGDGGEAPVDPFLVDDDEGLLGHRQARHDGLGHVHRADPLVRSGRVDRGEEVRDCWARCWRVGCSAGGCRRRRPARTASLPATAASTTTVPISPPRRSARERPRHVGPAWPTYPPGETQEGENHENGSICRRHFGNPAHSESPVALRPSLTRGLPFPKSDFQSMTQYHARSPLNGQGQPPCNLCPSGSGFGVPGLAQHALGDHVALHFTGPPGDGQAAGGEEPLLPPLRVTVEHRPLGPVQRHAHLLDPLLMLDPEQLAHTRPAARDRPRRGCARSSGAREGPGIGPRSADAPAPRCARARPRDPGGRWRGAAIRRRGRTTPPTTWTRARWTAWCARCATRRRGSPITASSGTKTSVRNTSLNMAAPVSSRRGLMSMPSACMSTMK